MSAKFCDPNDRATPGTKRFKIACPNYDRPHYAYVLAPDEAAARTFYTRETGIDAARGGRRLDGRKDLPPRLEVIVLPD